MFKHMEIIELIYKEVVENPSKNQLIGKMQTLIITKGKR